MAGAEAGSPAARVRLLGARAERAGPAGAAVRGLLEAHGCSGFAEGERAGGERAGVVLEVEGVEVGGVEVLRELESSGYLGRVLGSAAFGRGFLRGGGGPPDTGTFSPPRGATGGSSDPTGASQLSPVRSPGALEVIQGPRAAVPELGDSLSSVEALRTAQVGAASATVLSPPSARWRAPSPLGGSSGGALGSARVSALRGSARRELLGPVAAVSPHIIPRGKKNTKPVSVSLDTGMNPELGEGRSQRPWRQLDMRPSQEELFMQTFAGAKRIGGAGSSGGGTAAGGDRYMKLLEDIESSLESLFDLEKPVNWPLDTELEDTLAALDNAPQGTLGEGPPLHRGLDFSPPGLELRDASLLDAQSAATQAVTAADLLQAEAAAALGQAPPSPLRRSRQLLPTVSNEDVREHMRDPLRSSHTGADSSGLLLPNPPSGISDFVTSPLRGSEPALPNVGPPLRPLSQSPTNFAGSRVREPRETVAMAGKADPRPRHALVGRISLRVIGKVLRLAASLAVGVAAGLWVDGRSRLIKAKPIPRKGNRMGISTGSRERRRGTAGKSHVAHYTVAEGECLWSISGDVLSDPRNWRSLYHALAAKGLVEDPRDLEPGMDLAPALADLATVMRRKDDSAPPGGPVLVRVLPGDTLKSISNLVYGDPELWERITGSNPVSFDDSGRGSLRVGQVLKVP